MPRGLFPSLHSNTSLVNTEKKSSIAFTKYFSKTIQQMKVNAIYLIEIEFLGTRSNALPANQHVHLISYRKTKICVISQHLNTPVDQ